MSPMRTYRIPRLWNSSARIWGPHRQRGGSGLAKKKSDRPIAVFHPEFLEDLRPSVQTERRVALRVLDLTEPVLRDPFQGIGKPEPRSRSRFARSLSSSAFWTRQASSPRTTPWNNGSASS